MAKTGRKLTYDSAKLPQLVESVRKAHGSLGQVADFNCIPRVTFYDWIRNGEEDMVKGLNTQLAQLSSSIRKEQGIVVMEMLEEARGDDKKSKFIMWLLSRICREDFGVEGMEIKELRDLFRILVPMIDKGKADGR